MEKYILIGKAYLIAQIGSLSKGDEITAEQYAKLPEWMKKYFVKAQAEKGEDGKGEPEKPPHVEIKDPPKTNDGVSGDQNEPRNPKRGAKK